MVKEFRYVSGELVCVGDHVESVGGRKGVVQELLLPGSQVANQFFCPNGGVLIMEDWSGVQSPRIISVPDGEDWEEVIFLERKA